MEQISIVKSDEAIRRNRFDSEFYLVIDLLNSIEKRENTTLHDISNWITQGPNPKFTEEGVLCLTGRNIASGNVILDGADIVSNEEYSDFEKFKLKKGDILITLKGAGSTGKIGIYDLEDKAIFSRNLGLIRISKEYRHLLGYVFIFLISKIGQKIVDAGVTGGTGQLTLPTGYLKDIKVPLLSEKFIKKSKEDLEDYLRLIKKSNDHYNQAEDLLLEELGFEDFRITHNLTFEKDFKSMTEARRFDAEYFQPKFNLILNRLEDYKGKTKLFCEAIKINDKNFFPETDESYNYIELANISGNGSINGCISSLGKDLPTRARRLIHTNDVIISSIEGSLDSCALITNDFDNSLCSTGFFVLRSNEINSETLLVLFKSFPYQNLLKKSCSGTILTAISKEELEKIKIPIINLNVQKTIKSHINECYRLRSEAIKLLSTSKEAIDREINNLLGTR